MRPNLFEIEDDAWLFRAAWLTKRHDCTLAGIVKRCHGGCCDARYWPGKSSGGPVCHWLGPNGCTLSADDKPVTCLLYPLREKNARIGLHFRTGDPKSVCQGNHGQGPLLVDALRDNLISLLGPDEYDRLRASVLAGNDYRARIPARIAKALREEQEQLEPANKIPDPRTKREQSY